MSASPGSRSPSLSQNTSLASFGHVGDEKDFEKLPSVTSNVYTSQIHVKRFSVPKEDVSISNISEGFSFGAKKPPRPGQFSERPKTEQSQTNETSKFFHSTSTVPRIPPPNPPRPPSIRIPRPPPLDLPEIGLVGRQPSPMILLLLLIEILQPLPGNRSVILQRVLEGGLLRTLTLGPRLCVLKALSEGVELLLLDYQRRPENQSIFKFSAAF
ncbi:hypothetical protein FCULG_00002136 [Fusarium culmorum]|uniref:Uncharacterized protein n=1 Tax=Fusarium culmorum TaxID=5516 RepID=A0A2T4GNN9_FUSCU|nr:hypothetical protein FCULG_00002136 [Fusarium culmorum]